METSYYHKYLKYKTKCEKLMLEVNQEGGNKSPFTDNILHKKDKKLKTIDKLKEQGMDQIAQIKEDEYITLTNYNK